jgi:SH3 domain-containing YSC84-like protein 1
MMKLALLAPSRSRKESKFSLHILFCTKGAEMKRHLVLVVLSLTALIGNLAWAGSTREDATERLQNSADVLKEIAAAPDKGIPEEVLKSSKCIVVIPHLVKAGFIFGAKHGRGVAVCRTGDGPSAGWSAPAFISVSGGSWGLQIGAEGVDLVMLVMNDSGLRHLLSSKFEITGEGSAAAGPVGRHASAGTDWMLNTEFLTYSRSRGIFAGLTLEGAVVEQDADSTVAIYGDDFPFKKILRGEVAAPAPAAPFLRAVAEITHQARAQEAREQGPDDREQKREDQK